VSDAAIAGMTGQIVDVETGQPVVTAQSVRFYDALAYAGGDNTELTVASLDKSGGRFTASGIQAPVSGQLAIVIDDRTGATDDFVTTVNVVPYDPAADLVVSSYRQVTDAAWASALPSGTPSTRAAVLYTFEDQGAPVAGVTVSGAASSWVFTDASSASHETIEAGAVTGADGAFLVTGDADPSQLVGTGGLPPACGWSTPTARGRYMTLTVATVPSTCKV
jgi:hypothetical protein